MIISTFFVYDDIIKLVMQMEKWIDLSIEIDENYLVYPGDSQVEIEQIKTIAKDRFNMKTVNINMHVGTHMDFKSHMLETEERSEDFPISKMIGKANVVRPRVIDNVCLTKDIITAYEQAGYKSKILLVDLGHAKLVNQEEYYNQPKFEQSLFPFLVKNGIDVFGCDSPTVVYHDSKDMLEMHHDLLGSNITIVENLTNLDKLTEVVDFIALPLKIKGMDGSLLRAVAKNIVIG